MTQQIQKQRSTTDQTETAEVEVPTEVNDQSTEVSEDAACCLADIDEVLKDCDPTPKLTDEEILAAGHPNSHDPKYDKPGGDAFGWDYDAWRADEDKFHEAYERVHGVEYEHSGCGCSH